MADIRKRTGKNGTTYQVRYANPAAKTGYSYATFDTLKEARAFREDSKARQHANPRHPEITTVTQAIDRWLEICEHEGRHGKDPVTPAVLNNYRRRARAMKGYAWDKHLNELQAPDIVRFRSWLLQNFTRDQARSTLSSFHSMLLEMRTQGVLIADPASGISIQESRYKEPVAIPSVTEMHTILETCDRLANSRNSEIANAWERYRPMIYLAAESGMRPQEYLALPVASLADNGVRVLQALDASNKIGAPKTKAGLRFIPVGAEPLAMARHYATKRGDGSLVFPSRNGGHQPYRYFLRRGWHRLMEESGLMEEHGTEHAKELTPKYPPYALRHFFASMLIHQNKNLKFIQTVMGHKDIKMTFDVYGHIIKEREAKDLEGYSGILNIIRHN
jgi:integrase